MSDLNASALQIQLPQMLDLSAAETLFQELKSKRGSDVAVNASNVMRVGVQTLQVLLSAVKTWKADNNTFSLVHPSSEFSEGLALLGLSQTDFSTEGFVE